LLHIRRHFSTTPRSNLAETAQAGYIPGKWSSHWSSPSECNTVAEINRGSSSIAECNMMLKLYSVFQASCSFKLKRVQMLKYDMCWIRWQPYSPSRNSLDLLAH